MSDQLIWFVWNFIMDSLSWPYESLEILGNFFHDGCLCTEGGYQMADALGSFKF